MGNRAVVVLACALATPTELRLYVNGVEHAVTSASADIPAQSSNVAVGQNDPGPAHPDPDDFAGMIDELRIGSRARSTPELAADAMR